MKHPSMPGMPVGIPQDRNSTKHRATSISSTTLNADDVRASGPSQPQSGSGVGLGPSVPNVTYPGQNSLAERLAVNNRAATVTGGPASSSYHRFAHPFRAGPGPAVRNPDVGSVATPGIAQHANRGASNITQAVAQSAMYGTLSRAPGAFPRSGLSPRTAAPLLSPGAAPLAGGAIAPYKPFPATGAHIRPPLKGCARSKSSIGADTEGVIAGANGPSISYSSFNGPLKTPGSKLTNLSPAEEHNEAFSSKRCSSPSSSITPPTSTSASTNAVAPSEAPSTRVRGAIESGRHSFDPVSSVHEDRSTSPSDRGGSPASTDFLSSARKHSGTNFDIEAPSSGDRLPPPVPRKRQRTGQAMLPPGYLERRGGKVLKATTSGDGAEAAQDRAGRESLVAATRADSGSSSSQDQRKRWLLTHSQVLEDISTMKRDMLKSVAIEVPVKPEESKTDVGAILPDSEELQAAGQDNDKEKALPDKFVAAQDTPEVRRKGEKTEAAAGNGVLGFAAAAAGVDRSGPGEHVTVVDEGREVGSQHPRAKRGSTDTTGTIDTELDMDLTAASSADANSASGHVSACARSGSRTRDSAVASEDVGEERDVDTSTCRNGSAKVMLPSRDHILDVDATRDGLMLKNIMIAERTRERRRSLMRERTKGQAVLHCLTQLEREERGRSNLLRTKASILADIAGELVKRSTETEGLTHELHTLKTLPPSSASLSETRKSLTAKYMAPGTSTAALARGKGKRKLRCTGNMDINDVDEHPAHIDEMDCLPLCDRKSERGALDACAPHIVENSHIDVHAATAHAMLECWHALGERLNAARTVVHHVDVDEAGASSTTGSCCAEDSRLRGARGRSGARGKTRRVEAVNVDDVGGSVQSSASSDDSEGSGMVHVGSRTRKRKAVRGSVPVGIAAARKRSRKDGAGGAAGMGNTARERLDWPSTVIPRTPYDVPLLLSCLSTYPDKVAAALYPSPQSRADTNAGDQKCVADILPSFHREEILRQTHLRHKARFEQAESVIRTYTEACRSLDELKPSASKLKSTFRRERQDAERLMWRHDLEDLEAAVARATPAPTVDTSKDFGKGKGKPTGRRGATAATRAITKELSAAQRLDAVDGEATGSPTVHTSAGTVASLTTRSLLRGTKPSSSTGPIGAKPARDAQAGADPVGTRRARSSSKATSRPPSPAVGRRSSTRGSESKAKV